MTQWTNNNITDFVLWRKITKKCVTCICYLYEHLCHKSTIFNIKYPENLFNYHYYLQVWSLFAFERKKNRIAFEKSLYSLYYLYFTCIFYLSTHLCKKILVYQVRKWYRNKLQLLLNSLHIGFIYLSSIVFEIQSL